MKAHPELITATVLHRDEAIAMLSNGLKVIVVRHNSASDCLQMARAPSKWSDELIGHVFHHTEGSHSRRWLRMIRTRQGAVERHPRSLHRQFMTIGRYRLTAASGTRGEANGSSTRDICVHPLAP